jgi:hypothetical protein
MSAFSGIFSCTYSPALYAGKNWEPTQTAGAAERRVHLTGSPGARPSGRFIVRREVKETIDLRAGDVEAA